MSLTMSENTEELLTTHLRASQRSLGDGLVALVVVGAEPVLIDCLPTVSCGNTLLRKLEL